MIIRPTLAHTLNRSTTRKPQEPLRVLMATLAHTRQPALPRKRDRVDGVEHVEPLDQLLPLRTTRSNALSFFQFPQLLRALAWPEELLTPLHPLLPFNQRF
jgi:hypothetical protein